ncbi:MAG: type II secretion system protein [Kiritimatiellae bacterium]|nr:type II secretion system protein [Kiritimatiellia bacterium]
MSPSRYARSGFTLVELVMVIALIAMIATLAVNRLSGIRGDSADKLNFANLSRVANIVDAFAIANDGIPDRLDSLFGYDLPTGTAGSFASASDASRFLSRLSDANTGLHPDLTNSVSYYGHAFAPLLGTYFLAPAEADALRRAGLSYLMRATDGNHLRTGDDHAWAPDSATNSPDAVSCLATLVTNASPVAVVNPFAVSADIQPAGPAVYQACGEDVVFSTDFNVYIDGNPYSSNADALAALRSGPGILLAFGLGQYASIVGASRSGIADAPVSPALLSSQYRRYILLFRLVSTPSSSTVEFAGVMDPRGRVASQLRPSR